MLQPILENGLVKLCPLQESDFEILFLIASDEKIWEQHPDKSRGEREGFEKFFQKAIDSKGAFTIFDQKTQQIIGSTRFYEWLSEEKSVLIGYTFLPPQYWGTSYNHSIKTMMIDYAFSFVESVLFHIDIDNIRSQKAVQKLGAKIIGEIEKEYSNLPNRMSWIYEIKKTEWLNKKGHHFDLDRVLYKFNTV